MQLHVRFQPHRRGFGFLTPVADDGLTPQPVTLPDAEGTEHSIARAFAPPPVARALVADDLVRVTVALDPKGAAAQDAEVLERPRRLLVGTVARRKGGQLVVEPEASLAAGRIALDDALAGQLAGATDQQVVLLATPGEGGQPVAQALVAGPQPATHPDAIRARAVAMVLGGAAPSLVAGGPEAVGLERAAAETTHLRLMGQLAAGRRGGAAGLDRSGHVPGAELTPVDRRDEPCVTVDAALSRELDDAVAATWDGESDSPVRVAVHIADVAGAVGIGSPADRYARTVGATAYLASSASAPMLDPELSEGARSLVVGQDRPALSVRFSVHTSGAVSDVAVELARIRSRAKLSYGAVESWLAGDAKPLRTQARSHAEAAEATVRQAVEAARRLGVERDARDTLEDLFEPAELTPAVAGEHVQLGLAEPHAEAFRLIERVMVAANEAVGDWLVAHEVPALYRAHEGIDPERQARLRAAADLAGEHLPALDADAGDPDRVAGEILGAVHHLAAQGRTADRDLLIAAATGATARATYDPDPARHRGLGTTAYTHFTSPLRRYADLSVHRQIRAVLAGEAPPHSIAELEALATWLGARAGALARLEARERSDLWTRLLELGELTHPETATVTGLTPAGLRIRLPRLGLPGFIVAEQALGTGEERATLEVDRHGLTTTSGEWRVGARLTVRFDGRDELGRAAWRLVGTSHAMR